MSDRSDVQIIKSPNSLMKAKTGSGRVKPDGQAIQRAEAAIKKTANISPNERRTISKRGTRRSPPPDRTPTGRKNTYRRARHAKRLLDAADELSQQADRLGASGDGFLQRGRGA